MIRKLLSFVLLLGLALPSLSQGQVPTTTTPVPVSAPGADMSGAMGASGNKADGLELPDDQTVKFDEGFVKIAANCKGTVKWLVISATKVKYFTLPANNTIIISVPPQGGLITVFAVGLVDGKLTDFTRTAVTVSPPGPVTPGPVTPGPGPGPQTAMHVTFVVDLNNTTPALGQIINSQKIKEAITTRNAYYRLYDAQSSVLKEKGLDKVMAQSGGAPLIIVQTNNGNIVSSVKMPGTEADVIQYLNKALGGN